MSAPSSAQPSVRPPAARTGSRSRFDSLRLRLIASLGALLLAATALQVVASFRSALSEAGGLFDYQMAQMAYSLRDGAFGGTASTLVDRGDLDFVVQVWTAEGVRIYQSRLHLELPSLMPSGHSTVRLGNGRWRVFSLRAEHRVIQIAQAMAVRERMAFAMAARATWPIVPFGLAALAAAWWIVTAALAPVRRAGDELRRRGAQALEPLAAPDVPSEVRPLIDEINALMARIREAIDAQRRFVGDAAHELRSPLTALKLQLQLLERARDDAQRGVARERLALAVERAIRLVEQLLTLARAETPGVDDPRAFEPVDLRECAARAIAEMAPMAEARGVRVELDAPGAELAVPGDADALRMLVRNLVDNAIGHAPEGSGRVAVRLEPRAGAVRLSVEDDGPGIPAEERARVLDRFYRRAGEAGNGSGLGLAIVDAVARRHGTVAELDQSPTLGGLKVAVCLPRRSPAPLRADPAVPSAR